MENNEQNRQDAIIVKFLAFEKSLRNATNLKEFSFIALNDTKLLFNFEFAVFFSLSKSQINKTLNVSGTAQYDDYSPFLLEYKRFAGNLIKKQNIANQVVYLEKELVLNEDIKTQWEALELGFLIWIPIINQKTNEVDYGILYNTNNRLEESEKPVLKELQEVLSYSYKALSKGISINFNPFKNYTKTLIYLCLIGALFIPIDQYTIAPCEVIAEDSSFITTPLNGIIKDIHIEPNSVVEKGQKIVSLDNTAAYNQYESSLHLYKITKEKHENAIIKSFASKDSTKDVVQLEAELKQAKIDLEYNKEVLEKFNIYSPSSGIALFKDKDDWLGKPVEVGNVIMSIANPKYAELKIAIPVDDIIEFDMNAKVLVYFNIDPLSPVTGFVKSFNYQASVDKTGALAYHVTAKLADNQHYQIGWHGNAKIYGKQVSLFYYLFRRPILFVRKKIGV